MNIIATKSEFISELKKKIMATSHLTAMRHLQSRLIWLVGIGVGIKLSRKVNRPTALFLS
jgi:hypothetical protein